MSIPMTLDLANPYKLKSITKYRHEEGKLLIEFTESQPYFVVEFDNVIRGYQLKIQLGPKQGISQIVIYHVLEGQNANDWQKTVRSIDDEQNQVIVPLEDGQWLRRH